MTRSRPVGGKRPGCLTRWRSLLHQSRSRVYKYNAFEARLVRTSPHAMFSDIAGTTPATPGIIRWRTESVECDQAEVAQFWWGCSDTTHRGLPLRLLNRGCPIGRSEDGLQSPSKYQSPTHHLSHLPWLANCHWLVHSDRCLHEFDTFFIHVL